MNLYIVQNDTHYKNFIELGIYGDYVINLSRVTGQTLDFQPYCGKGIKEIKIDVPEANIYTMNSFQRILFCYNFKKVIKKVFIGISFKKIIIGNDGALQKIIIEAAKRTNRDLEVDMWLDGLVSLRHSKWVNSAKLILSLIAEQFKISFYFPSVIGTYSNIDKLYVMDDSVISELNSLFFSSRVKMITKVVFPRHENLLRIYSINKVSNSNRCRVLYLTSAWLFHGHHKWQQHQAKQIESLISYFNHNEEFDFRIRVHPRDNYSEYEHISSEHISSISLFEEDISYSDIVISARSTGLFESKMIGKEVIVYNEYFGDHFINDYLKHLNKCDNISELDLLLGRRKSS